MIKPGTIVGEKYRLEEAIGRGGMATVWRAIHTTLDRPVAVKFLEAVGAGAESLAERFLQEAKIAAGLRHRHVVDILDFGVVEGRPFMVMELLEGKSLADRFTEGPSVSDWELLETLAMVLGGLAAVHDAGILHRDVKPENIFLVEDADGIYPKLLDFGISRGFDAAAGRHTRTGAVVGTPSYMSPEQARGLKDIDLRSDLWSVGVILYEGLSGELPFESENPGDILIMVATAEPAPLSHHRPDLPADLVALVHRALAKDPALRFETAREMRDALLELLPSADGLSGRPSTAAVRTAFATGPGTGKLRALTAPTLEEPKVSLPALETSTPAARSRRAAWPWVVAALGLVVVAVAYVAYDQVARGALELPSWAAGLVAPVEPAAPAEVEPAPAPRPAPAPQPPAPVWEAPAAETIREEAPPPPATPPEEAPIEDAPPGIDPIDAEAEAVAAEGSEVVEEVEPEAPPANRPRRRRRARR